MYIKNKKNIINIYMYIKNIRESMLQEIIKNKWKVQGLDGGNIYSKYLGKLSGAAARTGNFKKQRKIELMNNKKILE